MGGAVQDVARQLHAAPGAGRFLALWQEHFRRMCAGHLTELRDKRRSQQRGHAAHAGALPGRVAVDVWRAHVPLRRARGARAGLHGRAPPGAARRAALSDMGLLGRWMNDVRSLERERAEGKFNSLTLLMRGGPVRGGGRAGGGGARRQAPRVAHGRRRTAPRAPASLGGSRWWRRATSAGCSTCSASSTIPRPALPKRRSDETHPGCLVGGAALAGVCPGLEGRVDEPFRLRHGTDAPDPASGGRGLARGGVAAVPAAPRRRLGRPGHAVAPGHSHAGRRARAARSTGAAREPALRHPGGRVLPAQAGGAVGQHGQG